MPVVDADCHVIETERTWGYFDEAELRYQPRKLALTNSQVDPGRQLFAIDGKLSSQAVIDVKSGRNLGSKKDAREALAGYSKTTDAMRTMSDIPGRLRHMDELGVDVQVLYPTVYLNQLTAKPEVDAALSRSYNRWLADIWQQAGGRLRWAAVPPLLDMREALDQVRWARDNGACAVFMRGFEDDRMLSDPYFFPLYEESERLDLAICVHSGCANPTYRDLVAGSAFSGAKVPVFSAFHHILYEGLPDKFPKLRFGFIEATASWVPYLITDLRRRMVRDGRKPLTDQPLRDNRLYVACQTNDDLPYILKYAGKDNLVIGSDYGHSDTSSELDALRHLSRMDELSPDVVKKILEDNPKALYAL
jgi:uncharacterized protein